MDASKCAIRTKTSNIKVEHETELITIEHELFKTLFNIQSKKLPLSTGKIKLTLRNVSQAVANGIRRALLNEMPGHALTGGQYPADAQHVDPFMSEEYVIHNIRQIPLKLMIDQHIIDRVEFSLHAVADGTEIKDVYSGDLTFSGAKLDQPLFNPTVKIARIRPGYELHIENIRIEQGTGHQRFSKVTNFGMKNLDIPRYTDEELRHKGGVAVDLSDYKISAGVCDSLEFELSFEVNAIKHKDEIKHLLADAIDSLIIRLKRLASKLGDFEEQGNILIVRFDDTYTLCELIKKAAFDLTENQVDSITMSPDYIKKCSTIEIHNKEPKKLLSNSIALTVDIYEQIKRLL